MIIRPTRRRKKSVPVKKEVAPKVTKAIEEKKHYPKKKEYKQVVKPAEEFIFSEEE